MSELTHESEAYERPFFLVGAVRSGTTLLRLLLGHHPQICLCEEMEFVATYLANNGANPDMQEYHRFLMLDRGFRMSGYSVDPSLTFVSQAKDFLRQRAIMDGKPIFGATVHHDFDQLPKIWPDARYVYLRRDPRDVARSCVQMGWAGTVWNGATFWVNANRAWARLKDSVPETQRHEIVFEELIDNSIGVLTNLCKFLETQFDPAMLEIEKDTTYRRPNPAEARSWKDTSKPREVRQVETRVGLAALEAAGYTPSGYPPEPDTRLARMRLKIEDFFVRVNFRRRRYGWLLWLSGVVVRRLPARGLREKVQLRIDEVDNLHLK